MNLWADPRTKGPLLRGVLLPRSNDLLLHLRQRGEVNQTRPLDDLVTFGRTDLSEGAAAAEPVLTFLGRDFDVAAIKKLHAHKGDRLTTTFSQGGRDGRRELR